MSYGFLGQQSGWLTSAVVATLLAIAWPSPLAFAQAGQPGASTATILGVAHEADKSPVRHARLRLRNAQSGRVDAHTVADEHGRFTFSPVRPGSYIVELVNERGTVLGLSSSLRAAPGDTLTTIVRMGSRLPWYDGFFANAAAAVAVSAAALGITAVAPEAIRPVSATQ